MTERRRLAAACSAKGFQAGLNIWQHSARRFGQGNPPPCPVEQPNLKKLLKGADLLTDRTGRDMQLIGCLAEAQVPRDRLESTQSVERGQGLAHDLC